MSFTYNGVNCESLGMFVEKFPNRPFPTKKVTTYNILGRNGDLIVEHGGYNNVIQEYEIYVNGSGSGLQANLTAIARWLLYSASGYAELIDTYDPSIYREARVVGGEEFINSLNRFGKATLQFDCKPQRFPTIPETITVTGTWETSTMIPIDNAKMAGTPLIEIHSVDANTAFRVVVGGTDVHGTTYSAGDITVDFENMTVNGSFISKPKAIWGTKTIGNNSIVKIYIGQPIQNKPVNATITTNRYEL